MVSVIPTILILLSVGILGFHPVRDLTGNGNVELDPADNVYNDILKIKGPVTGALDVPPELIARRTFSCQAFLRPRRHPS